MTADQDQIGVREMARQLGCAASLVHRYKGRGMPLESVDLARAWIRDNVRPGPRSRLGSGGPAAPRSPKADTYQAARARREMAEAEMAELEARRRAGALVNKAEVERGAFDAFRELRDATINALRDVADRLVGMTDVREIEHRLLDAYRAAHADFEGRMQRIIAERSQT